MIEPTQGSVTVSYTRALIGALERLGINPPEVAHSLLHEVESDQRVPLVQQEDVWLALSQSEPDPLLGLRIGSAIETAQLGLVGYLLMTQKTLGEALQQLQTYHPLVGEGGDFEIHRGAGYLDLRYIPNYLVCERLRVETVLSTSLTQARSMTGGRFRPRQVRFAYPAPSLAIQQQYQSLLDAPVQFGCDYSGIRLDEEALQIPCVAADRMVLERLRPEADALLQRLKDKSLQLRVSHLLQQNPELGREQIAERLHMSPRHLARKLTEEKVNFREIQDEVRSYYAKLWLAQNEKSLAEIAAMLGYCDESAFGKAFRRWTGQTPRSYRLQHREQG
ncbi:AraC family transcriptional regulator [Biformimicrobium ophioploci]|uniref:AraC family transcriptional regulator n=1 Tax=Biformimicrobium ophioploci TaxID=3036711 RepID=A0ABQ6M2E2_9GAMM|nr:AraC family transcriptional regulator [Microbulbifer sp. NKW57]GMG88486.1 AraC family transcriptional regulator [Microbulbifer sp. NKW57]